MIRDPDPLLYPGAPVLGGPISVLTHETSKHVRTTILGNPTAVAQVSEEGALVGNCSRPTFTLGPSGPKGMEVSANRVFTWGEGGLMACDLSPLTLAYAVPLGDFAGKPAPLPDGGAFVHGSVGNHAHLRRLDAFGVASWDTELHFTPVCAGATGADSGIWSVHPTPDGGAIVVGTSGAIGCPISAYLQNVMLWVAKVDAQGGIRNVVLDDVSVAPGAGIRQWIVPVVAGDAAGNVYVADSFVGIPDRTPHLVVSKFTPDGQRAWRNLVEPDPARSGTLPSHAVVAGDGMLLLAGKAMNVDASGGQHDVTTFISEVAANGQLVGAAAAVSAEIDDIVTDPAGRELYAVGRGADGHDVIVTRYDLDTDGDGISDDWELRGIPYGQGKRLDLHERYGVSALHKDIIVEVDAMAGGPSLAAPLAQVVNAFAAAPITNPDILPGVHLALDLDESGLPRQQWNNLAVDFDAFAHDHFGRAVDRGDADSAEKRAALRTIVHYGVFADSLSTRPRLLGIAEVGGNDFIIFPGSSFYQQMMAAQTFLPDPASARLELLAGCFMHELGHTFGLRHGGYDDLNNKPNYHSVMNYYWVLTPTDRASFAVDYSSSPGVFINELALNEAVGLGGDPTHTTHRKDIPTRFPLDGPATVDVPEIGPVDFDNDGRTDHVVGPYDWSGDGHISGSEQGYDLNNDKKLGAYSGYNDWASLHFFRWPGDDWSGGWKGLSADESRGLEAAERFGLLLCATDPQSYLCRCVTEGETRTCGTDEGVCTAGVETCTNGRWSACIGAVEPTMERCDDGLDNDCDGVVDDTTPALGATCTTGVGACARAGTSVCTAGEVTCTAIAGPPSPELCGDGIDNDCDGEIDEGFASIGQPCAAGFDPCPTGIYVCSDEGTLACQPRQDLPPSGEESSMGGACDDFPGGPMSPSSM